MVDPYKTDKRPRFPRILVEVLEEKKESENDGLWKPLLKEDKDLQKQVKQKEREKQEELQQDIFSTGKLDRTLEDIL